MTAYHALLLGTLMIIPVALIAKPRLRIATAAVPPVISLGALIASGSLVSPQSVIQRLSAGVMDLEVVDGRSAIASLADGSIVRLDLASDRLNTSVLATGL